DQLVDLLVAGGDHHQVGVAELPHPPAHLDAVETGQTEVEGDQVGVDLPGGGDGLAPVADLVHGEALGLEGEDDQFADVGVVLHDQRPALVVRAGTHADHLARVWDGSSPGMRASAANSAASWAQNIVRSPDPAGPCSAYRVRRRSWLVRRAVPETCRSVCSTLMLRGAAAGSTFSAAEKYASPAWSSHPPSGRRTPTPAWPRVWPASGTTTRSSVPSSTGTAVSPNQSVPASDRCSTQRGPCAHCTVRYRFRSAGVRRARAAASSSASTFTRAC